MIFEMHKKGASDRRNLARGLEIIYEDKDIIGVDKPAKLLTIGTDNGSNRAAAVYIISLKE